MPDARAMQLPIQPPLEPMLAKLARTIPDGDGWLYEPKWDGFRSIVFRDGDELYLQSRSRKPLNRYFPEVEAHLLAALPERVVVDGEIVVADPGGHGLNFDLLGQRIHPADSRVQRLATETPASFVAFDLLAIDDRSLTEVPFAERRALLEQRVAARPPLHLTPITSDRSVATEWFEQFEGAGLDGVIAKPHDGVYTPKKRSLMKVKHQRTAECVVAGYRLHKDGQGVGSLLLGLFDDEHRLHHVGVTASFTATFRAELLADMQPYTVDALVEHPWKDWGDALAHATSRMPGGQSRWSGGKDLSWQPVRCERVVEVTFGQLENHRFRHGVTFVRWRPDRDPSTCTYDQLDVADPLPFLQMFEPPGSPVPRAMP